MHSKSIPGRATVRGNKAMLCLLAGSVPAFAQLNTGNPQVLSTGQTITDESGGFDGVDLRLRHHARQ